MNKMADCVKINTGHFHSCYLQSTFTDHCQVLLLTVNIHWSLLVTKYNSQHSGISQQRLLTVIVQWSLQGLTGDGRLRRIQGFTSSQCLDLFVIDLGFPISIFTVILVYMYTCKTFFVLLQVYKPVCWFFGHLNLSEFLQTNDL